MRASGASTARQSSASKASSRNADASRSAIPQLFNLGRDVQLQIIGPGGLPFALSLVAMFEASQVVSRVRWDRCDGVQFGADLPKGWEGTFELERANSAADDFICAIESGWYANGMPGFGASMIQFIAEVGGGFSTYQFSNATFSLLQSGTWRIDTPTRQRLAFWAATRTRM